MSENQLRIYKGNCHCGAFRFEISIPELKSVKSCNCSICSKKGYLFISPVTDQLKITRGDNDLAIYEFSSKTMEHKFCPTCGTGVMIKRRSAPLGEDIFINARTLLDVNLFSLKINKFDGKTYYQQSYIPPPFTGKLPEVKGDGLKIYTGSCHCGAVTLAVKSKPLPEVQIKEDNCSICQRNANLCIYPHQSQVTIVGTENTTEYSFGRKFTGHRFCKICGVPVYMQIYGPPEEVFSSWSEARKEAVRGNFEILPVRVAVLNDVEWDQLKLERTDEGTDGYNID